MTAFAFLRSTTMALVMVSTMMPTALAGLSPIFSTTFPTDPEMMLSISEDTKTKDIVGELVMDEDNKYTAFVEIGDLLQGKILTADLKVWGIRTIDGVDMEEEVFLEMENVGPMIMSFVLNPSEASESDFEPYEDALLDFEQVALATLPEDADFWQALSTALQRWITQGSGSRMLRTAAANDVGGGLRGN